MAVLPASTHPPAWVTRVDVYDIEVNGSRPGRWQARVEGSGISVEQLTREVYGKLILSEPWVDIDAEMFQLTPREARALSRDLVKAAQTLDLAIATWDLLGSTER